MNFVSLNPEENKKYLIERDILSVFKTNKEKNNQIHQNMSPCEIAEVVSDHLISMVRKQFETTKKEFRSKVQL